MIDSKAFGEELAGIVKAATMPLLARIDALEKAMAERRVEVQVTTPDASEIKAVVDEAVAGIEWPEPEDLGERIKSAAAEAVASIPAPKDGSPGKDGADGRDGVDGKPGASVTIDDVMPELHRRVDEYLAALPVPKDGADGRDGVDGKPGEPGERGEKGADGIGLAGALIDRDGNLVVTLTNGEAKSLGSVVGKDGRDGDAGKPGVDGVGFDDMTLDYDGERTFTFLFQKGERIVERSFKMPVVLDRGVYSDARVYEKGDSVTLGGSTWIAQCETKARPDGSSDWRLSNKKGRDGRDGVMKPPSDRGPVRVGGGNAG